MKSHIRPILWGVLFVAMLSFVVGSEIPKATVFAQEGLPRAMAMLQFPLSPNYSASITTPVYGTVAVAGTTTATLITGTANQRIYITQAWGVCTAATDSVIAINDGATNLAYISCPESKISGAVPVPFNPPLRWSAGTAATAAFSASVTTGYITIQGYKALN